MFDYTKYTKTWERSEYQLKLNEEAEEQRKIRSIENEKQMKIRLQKEEEETNEFMKFFEQHPLSNEMIDTLKEITPSKRMKANPTYILDKYLNIIEVVPSKNNVGYWLRNNGHSKKVLARTTIFEYIRNQLMYKNKFYFVPASDYEKFMKEVFVI